MKVRAEVSWPDGTSSAVVIDPDEITARWDRDQRIMVEGIIEDCFERLAEIVDDPVTALEAEVIGRIADAAAYDRETVRRGITRTVTKGACAVDGCGCSEGVA